MTLIDAWKKKVIIIMTIIIITIITIIIIIIIIIIIVSDVLPASKALMAQFRILRENFQVEPMICAGLPGFAQQAMYLAYEGPSAFSIPQRFEHIVRLFRENTLGGICNVYQRHATTRDEPNAAYAAKFNDKG